MCKLTPVNGQTLAARYQVTHDIIGSGPLQDKQLAAVESTGYLYRDGGRYLYYEKPGYLDKYPNGIIALQIDANNSYNYSLCTDTLQQISYTDVDSLIRVYRPNVNGVHGQLSNYRQKFESDYFTWLVLPETKMINGLKCQKATMSIRNKLQWVVWFTRAVAMQGGVKGIIGVPGLVVEAECPPLRTKYTLLNFTESVPLKTAVFDLAELKEPYIQMKPLLKANILPAVNNKMQRQAELTNQ